MSRKVNDSIFRLIDAGHVTSATMMANAPFIEEACNRALEYPDCSFGAHLNLTEFPPLTGVGKLGPLLNQQGSFDENNTRNASIDSSISEGLVVELRAQIEKLHSLGIIPRHLDSHHHIHTLPRYFGVLKQIQKEYQIRKVRITRNIYATRENPSKTLLIKKIAFNFALRHYYRTNTTQGFTDFKTFIEHGVAGQLKHEIVEIMVHPGSAIYEDESEDLASPWQEQMKFPVRLINYRDIN